MGIPRSQVCGRVSMPECEVINPVANANVKAVARPVHERCCCHGDIHFKAFQNVSKNSWGHPQSHSWQTVNSVTGRYAGYTRHDMYAKEKKVHYAQSNSKESTAMNTAQQTIAVW